MQVINIITSEGVILTLEEWCNEARIAYTCTCYGVAPLYDVYPA